MTTDGFTAALFSMAQRCGGRPSLPLEGGGTTIGRDGGRAAYGIRTLFGEWHCGDYLRSAFSQNHHQCSHFAEGFPFHCREGVYLLPPSHRKMARRGMGFVPCLLLSHPVPIPWLSIAPLRERYREPPPRVPYAKTVTPDCFCYPPAAAATARRFLS